MNDLSVQQQGKMLNNQKNDNSFVSKPDYDQLVLEVANLRKLYQNLEKQMSQGSNTGNIDLKDDSSQFGHLTKSYKCLKYEVKQLKSADILNRLSTLESDVSQQAMLWNNFSDYFQDFVKKLGKNDSSSNKICSQMKYPLNKTNSLNTLENQHNILNDSNQELQSRPSQSNKNVISDNSILIELNKLKQQVQSLNNRETEVEQTLSTHNLLWDQFKSNVCKLISTQNASEKYQKDLEGVHEQFSQMIREIAHENNEGLGSNSTLEQRLEKLEKDSKIQSSLWNHFSTNISRLISLDDTPSSANSNKEQKNLQDLGYQVRELLSELNNTNEQNPISDSSIRDMKHLIEESKTQISSLEEKVRQHSNLWGRFQENIHTILNIKDGKYDDLNYQFAEDIRSLVQIDGGKVTTRDIQLKPSTYSNSGNENDRLSRLENNVRVHENLWNLFMQNVNTAMTNNSNTNSDQLANNHDAFVSMVGDIVRKNSNNNNSNSSNDQLYRINQLESKVRAQSHLWEQFVNNLQNSINANTNDKNTQTLLTKEYNEYHSQLEKLIEMSDGMTNNNNNSNVQSNEDHASQQAIEEIRSQLKKLEMKHEQDIKRIQDEIKQENQSVKNRFNEIKSNVQDMEHKQTEAEKTTNEMIQSVQDQQTKQLQSLQKDLSTSKKDLKAQQQSQKSQKDELENIKKQLQKYQQQKQNQEEEHHRLDEELKNLQNSQQQQQTNLEKHQQDYQKLQKDLQKVQKSQQTQEKSVKNYQTDLQKLQTAQNVQNKALKDYQEEQRKLHEEERKQQEEAHQKLEETLQKLETAQQNQEKSVKSVQKELEKVQKSQQSNDKTVKNYKSDIQKLQTAQEEQDKALKAYQSEQRQLHEDEHKQEEEAHQKLEETLQKLETAQQNQEKSVKSVQKELEKVQKSQQSNDKTVKNYKSDIQKLQTAQQEQDKSIKNYQTEMQKLCEAQQEEIKALKANLEEYRQLHDDEHKQQEEAHQKIEEMLQKLQVDQEAQAQSIKNYQADLQKVQKSQQSSERTVKNYKSDLQKLQTAQQKQEKAIRDFQDEQRQQHEDDHKQQEESHQKLNDAIQKLQAAQDKSAKNYQTELQKLQKTQQTQERSVKNSQTELQKLQKAQQIPDGVFKTYQEEQRKLHEEERKQQEEAHQKLDEEIQTLRSAQQSLEKSLKNCQNDIQKAQKSQDSTLQNYQEEQRQIIEDEHKQQEEAHLKLNEAIQKLEAAQQAQEKTVKNCQSDLQKVQKSQQTNDKTVKNYKSDIQKLQTAQQDQDKSIKNYQSELQKLQTAQNEQNKVLKDYQEEQRQLHEEERKQQEEAHQKLEETLQKIETAQQNQEKSVKSVQKELEKVQKSQQSNDKTVKNYKSDIQKLQTAQEEQDKALKAYQSEQRQLHEDEHKQEEEAHQKLEETLQKLETAQQTQDKALKTVQKDLEKVQKSQQSNDKTVKNYKSDIQKLQTAQEEQDKALKAYQSEQRQLHEDEHKQEEEAHQKLEETLQKLETAQQTQDKALKTVQKDLEKVEKAQKTQDKSVKNSQAELQKIQQAQQAQQVPDDLFKSYQEEQRKLHEEEHKQQEEAHQKLDEEIQALRTAQQSLEKALKNHQNDLQKVQKSQQTQDKSAKSSQTDLQKLQAAQEEQAKAMKEYQEQQQQIHDKEHQKIEESLQKLEAAQQKQEKTVKNCQSDLQKVQKAQDKSLKNYQDELQKLSSKPENDENIQRIEEQLQKHSSLLQEHYDIFTNYQQEQAKHHEEDHKHMDEEHQKLENELQKIQNEQHSNDEKVEQIEKDVDVHNKLWQQFTKNLNGLLNVDQNEALNKEAENYHDQIKELSTRNADIQELADEESLKSLAQLRREVNVHSALLNQFVQNLQKLNIINQEEAIEMEDGKDNELLKLKQKEFANKISILADKTAAPQENVDLSQIQDTMNNFENQLSTITEKVDKHSELWQNYDRNLRKLLDKSLTEPSDNNQFENEVRSMLVSTRSVDLNPNQEENGKAGSDLESRLADLEKDVDIQKSLWEQFSKNLQVLLNCDSDDEQSRKDLKQNRDSFVEQISKLVNHNDPETSSTNDNNNNNNNNASTIPDLRDQDERIKDLEEKMEANTSLWKKFLNNVQSLISADSTNSPESNEMLKNCHQDFVNQMKSLVKTRKGSAKEEENPSFEQLAREVREIRNELNALRSGNPIEIQDRDAKLDEASLSERYAKNPQYNSWNHDITNIRSAYDINSDESHPNDEEISSSFEEPEYCQESSEYSAAYQRVNDNDDNENGDSEDNNENDNNANENSHHRHHHKKSSSNANARNQRNNNYTPSSKSGHNDNANGTVVDNNGNVIGGNTPVNTREVLIHGGDSHTTNIIQKVNSGPIQEQLANIYNDLNSLRSELNQVKNRVLGNEPIAYNMQDGNRPILNQLNPQSPGYSANYEQQLQQLRQLQNEEYRANIDNELNNVDIHEESTESESEGHEYTIEELHSKIKLNKKNISKLQRKFDLIQSSMSRQGSLWNQFDLSLHQLLNATLSEMEMPTNADLVNLQKSMRCVKYEIKKIKSEEKARTKEFLEKKKVQEKELQFEIAQLVEEVQKLQKVCAKFNNKDDDLNNKQIHDSIKCLKHEVRNLKKSAFSSASNTEQKSTSNTEQPSMQTRKVTLSDENKKSTTSDNNSTSKFASQASLDEWINEVKSLRNLYHETIQFNSEIRPLSLMSEEAASSSSFIDENGDSRLSKTSDQPMQVHEIYNYNTNQAGKDDIKEQVFTLNNEVRKIRSTLKCLKHEIKRIQYESNPQNKQKIFGATLLSTSSSSSSQERFDKLNASNNDQSFESRIELIEKALAKIKYNMKNNTAKSSTSKKDNQLDDENGNNQDESQVQHDIRCLKYELKQLKDNISKQSLSQDTINNILASKDAVAPKDETESSRIIQYIFTQLEELPRLKNEIQLLKKQHENEGDNIINERDVVLDLSNQPSEDSKSVNVKQLVNDVERIKAQLSSLNGRLDYIVKSQPSKDDSLINGSISNFSSFNIDEGSLSDLLISDQSGSRYDEISREVDNLQNEIKRLTSQISTIQDIISTTIRAPEDGEGEDIKLTQAQQQLIQQRQQRFDEVLNDLNNVKDDIKAIKANQFLFSDNSSVSSMGSVSSIPGASKNEGIAALARKYKKLQEQQKKLQEQINQLSEKSPSSATTGTTSSAKKSNDSPLTSPKASHEDPANSEIMELKETMKAMKLDQSRIKKLVSRLVQGERQQTRGLNDKNKSELDIGGDAKDIESIPQHDDNDTLKHELNQVKRTVAVLKRETSQLTTSSKNMNSDIEYLKSQYEMIRGELMKFASISTLASTAKASGSNASSDAQKKKTATPAATKK